MPLSVDAFKISSEYLAEPYNEWFVYLCIALVLYQIISSLLDFLRRMYLTIPLIKEGLSIIPTDKGFWKTQFLKAKYYARIGSFILIFLSFIVLLILFAVTTLRWAGNPEIVSKADASGLFIMLFVIFAGLTILNGITDDRRIKGQSQLRLEIEELRAEVAKLSAEITASSFTHQGVVQSEQISPLPVSFPNLRENLLAKLDYEKKTRTRRLVSFTITLVTFLFFLFAL